MHTNVVLSCFTCLCHPEAYENIFGFPSDSLLYKLSKLWQGNNENVEKIMLIAMALSK